jgi:hypothetical protein
VKPPGPVRTGLLLSMAHHPLCTRFRHDVVRLAGLPVCSGCLATWPVFLLLLPVAVQARLHGAPALALLAVGVVLALPQVTAYRRRGRRSTSARTSAKVLGGAGLAAALAGALTAGWPLFAVVAAIGTGVLATAALQAVRLRGMLATCDACPYRRDWEACPGMVGAGPVLPEGPTSLLDG